jgi:hypothetical protein
LKPHVEGALMMAAATAMSAPLAAVERYLSI